MTGTPTLSLSTALADLDFVVLQDALNVLYGEFQDERALEQSRALDRLQAALTDRFS